RRRDRTAQRRYRLWRARPQAPLAAGPGPGPRLPFTGEQRQGVREGMSETGSRGPDASPQAGPPAGARGGGPARPAPRPGRGRRRRRVLAAGAAMVVAAAGVTIAVTGPFAGAGHAGGGLAAGGYPTSLSAIARRLLQAQTNVSATLGYAGSYTVTGHGGTLTW